MPDAHADREPSRQDLAWRALLYSSGELDSDAAAEFEGRLAVDQEARDALAQAVQLTLMAAGAPSAPDPRWRAAAGGRLQRHASLGQRLWGQRVYRGHPAAWAVLGAAAAALLLALFSPARPGPQSQAPPLPPLPPAEVAAYWAELQNSDHLAKAHDEAARRKMRAEDRTRLARTDERRLPRTGASTSKPH